MLSRKHHLAKSVIYRIYATLISVLVIWFFTRSWIWSLSIGLVENLVKIFTYYLYERIWLRFALPRFYKTPIVGDRAIFENATIKFVDDTQ